ncbi:hypothetical protein ABE426_14440 [Sphingobacterium faecium]|jgi:hypothetical protein|uniref:hypothetical protein n=1 Tax=Sphingobacterium faecium TaxID=34087 RepID=UPI0032095C4D
MSLMLNNQQTEALGLYFKKGILYKELLKYPKAKQRYTYNWPDQHGEEIDRVSPTYYESLNYSIACYLEAENIEDLQVKRGRILELISAPEGFLLKSETLGRTFRLFYLDSPSFNTINPIWNKGQLYCEFMLNFKNNFDKEEQVLALADVKGLILTELGEQIYVTDNRRVF